MTEYRFERKFLVSGLSRYQVESIIRLHPSMFSEIYYERFVNNIYFDSLDMTNYFKTVDGSPNRLKVRIRWYNDLLGPIDKPVLELKIKSGLLGKKESYALVPFELDDKVNSQMILDVIDRSSVPDTLKDEFRYLNPTLLNRYRRKYYQSGNRSFRITLDTDQFFYQIGSRNNSFLNMHSNDFNIVLELKYSRHMDLDANRITNYFPFRMTRNAKYVNGINFLYLW